MHMLFRVLGGLSRNTGVPVLAILAGWYGGAKYGAPDYVMSAIDGVLSQGAEIAGEYLPGAKQDDAAPASGDEV